MPEISIRQATVGDEGAVFTLISALLCEIDPEMAHLYAEQYLMPVIRDYLASDCGVYIFIGVDEDGVAQGAITLNECKAIYAFGSFGEISELYVNAVARSSGLGARLIDTAEDFARTKGWSQLEVGAPDVPKWQRSVDFYHRCGYETIGPRLYKWLNLPA